MKTLSVTAVALSMVSGYALEIISGALPGRTPSANPGMIGKGQIRSGSGPDYFKPYWMIQAKKVSINLPA